MIKSEISPEGLAEIENIRRTRKESRQMISQSRFEKIVKLGR